MARVRSSTIRARHAALLDAAAAWADVGAESLRGYGFAHGVSHGLGAERLTDTEALVAGFEYYLARLEALGRPGTAGLREDLEALAARGDDEAVADDARFFRQASHLLTRTIDPSESPADGHPVTEVLVQLAAEAGEDGRLGAGAWAWLAEGGTDRDRLLARQRGGGGQGACTAVMEHANDIGGALWLDDGGLLSWASFDGSLHVWDAHGGEVASVQAHESGIKGAVRLGDRLITSPKTYGDEPNTLRVWSLPDLGLVGDLAGHGSDVEGIEPLSDHRIATWSRDGDARVWDIAEPRCEHVFPIARPRVSQLFALAGDEVLVFPTPGSPTRFDLGTGGQAPVPALTSEGYGKGSVADHMAAIPGGRLLAWSERGDFFVLAPDLSERSVEGSLKEGAGKAGLLGGIPNQHMAVLDADTAASWGASTMFGKAPSEVRLWSLTTGEQVGAIPTEAPPAKVLPTPSGDLVVTDQEGQMSCLARDGEQRWRGKVGEKPLAGLLVSGDVLLGWAEGNLRPPMAKIIGDPAIHRVRLATGEPLEPWTEHAASVRLVSAGGGVVASLDLVGRLRASPVDGEGGVRELPGASHLQVADDGRIFVGMDDGRVLCLDASLEEPEVAADHGAPIAGLALTDSGVVSWCLDGRVRRPGREGAVEVPFGNDGSYITVTLHARDGRLVSMHRGDALRVWDVDEGALVDRQPVESADGVWVDGTTLATASGLWDLQARRLLVAETTMGDGLTLAPEALRELAAGLRPGAKRLPGGAWVSPASDALVVVGLDRETEEICPLDTGEKVHLTLSHGAVAAWTSTGRLARVDDQGSWARDPDEDLGITAAAAGADGDIFACLEDGRILRVGAMGPPQVLAGHAAEVLGFDGSGSEGVSWSKDRTVRRWSLEATDERDDADLGRHRGGVGGLLRLDGHRCVSWGEDGDLRIWNEQDGGSEAVLAAHTGPVQGVIELDGDLLSWAEDGLVLRWDVAIGEVRTRFTGHDGAVVGVHVLDGERLLSWSADNTLRLWSTADGEMLQVFEGHYRKVLGALPTDDGNLLSWSHDGTVRRWTQDGQEQGRIVLEEIPESAGFLSIARRVLSLRVEIRGAWALAWTDKKLAFWPSSEPSCEPADQSSAHVVDANGRVLRIGVLDHDILIVMAASTASLFGGGKPTLSFWELATGESLDMESLPEPLTRDALDLAFGGGAPDPTRTAGWRLDAEDRNVVVHRDGHRIVWVGTEKLTVHYLDDSGLGAATSEGGGVHLLQLHRGATAVPLTNASQDIDTDNA